METKTVQKDDLSFIYSLVSSPYIKGTNSKRDQISVGLIHVAQLFQLSSFPMHVLFSDLALAKHVQHCSFQPNLLLSLVLVAFLQILAVIISFLLATKRAHTLFLCTFFKTAIAVCRISSKHSSVQKLLHTPKK